MAKKVASVEPQPPVVVAVFEDLIKRLQADTSVDAAVIGRLRQALVDDQETSADALRNALFSEEPLP
ncbi:MAG: hypothetical protein ACOYXR_10325 [Nitrospirota bacterium]